MAALIGLIAGFGWQAIAIHVYEASPAEGFLAYGIGFDIGMIIAREARDKRER